MMAWLRWEFGRQIDVTPAIRFITFERLLKATVLFAGGAILLVLDRHNGAHQAILNIQSEYNLDSGRGLWRQLVSWALGHVAGVSNGHLVELALAGFLYGGLEAFEGIGLMLRRRWAEYLVLLATAAFIPVEVHELAVKPSLFKALALLLNLLIMAYLIWRKRLFLERPSQMRATNPPAPA
jgi:uncharacterized membrane protein (DUF2068 family)